MHTLFQYGFFIDRNPDDWFHMFRHQAGMKCPDDAWTDEYFERCRYRQYPNELNLALLTQLFALATNDDGFDVITTEIEHEREDFTDREIYAVYYEYREMILT
jgi:hypothetical protein